MELPLIIYSKRQDIEVIQSIKRLAKQYNLKAIFEEINFSDVFPLDWEVNDSFVLNNLRVCLDNKGGIHNYGKCGKCIRTMVTIEILGLLKESEIFPGNCLKNMQGISTHIYVILFLEFIKENLKLAKKYE